MLTNNEYMSDEARIQRVLNSLMDVPLKELREAHQQNIEYIRYVMYYISREENLEEQEWDAIPYAEFLRLVSNVGANAACHDYDSFAEQLLYFKGIAFLLLNSSSVVIPAKLFLAIPLGAFCSYMRKSAMPSALTDDFMLIQKRCTNWKECTIGDFLQRKIEIIQKAWLPTTSLEKYRECAETAHQDMGRILVGSFARAFPKKFQGKEVHEEYENDEWLEVPEEDLPFD